MWLPGVPRPPGVPWASGVRSQKVQRDILSIQSVLVLSIQSVLILSIQSVLPSKGIRESSRKVQRDILSTQSVLPSKGIRESSRKVQRVILSIQSVLPSKGKFDLNFWVTLTSRIKVPQGNFQTLFIILVCLDGTAPLSKERREVLAVACGAWRSA